MFATPAYAQAAGGAGARLRQFVPLILIFAIMYFLLIRPQQKKLKEHQGDGRGAAPGRPGRHPGRDHRQGHKVKDDDEVEVEIAEGVQGPGRARHRRAGADKTEPAAEQPEDADMLHIPLWKRVLIWGVVALGLLYRDAEPVLRPGRAAQRRRRRDRERGRNARTAARPSGAWPSWLPSGLVNLGLDLRGGAHLLAEVQVADVYADRMDGLWPEVRDALRDERDTVGTIRRAAAAARTSCSVRISRPRRAWPRAMEIVRGLAAAGRRR